MGAILIACLGLFSILKPQFTNPNEVPIKQATNHKTIVTPTVEMRKSFVLLDVPFTSQAPYGEWGDPRHQDGCEEAAALMAAEWSKSNSNSNWIDKRYAKLEIINAWDYQVENYGGARDTGAEDTAERIIGGYFKDTRYQILDLREPEDIVAELARGRIVIVPVDGRKLGNPYYTAPGPERHMIVIRGYDDETGEFITNDPGTRRGEKYRYKYYTLFNAIRDYPTGEQVPIIKIEKKMIKVGVDLR